ncbi:protein FAM89A isoform X3 [Chelonia mydas]|uniref:protein FAM89A isoform X3 n=1 Tax=Chelonia mydas TaxID=8469 RepID=UPI001CA93917|nr:protein FAM89A isoform X3 [Chelonia mydas]
MSSDAIRRFNVMDLVAGPNRVGDPLGERCCEIAAPFSSRYKESRLVHAIGTKEEPGCQMKFLQLWMEDATVALGEEVRSHQESSWRADQHAKQRKRFSNALSSVFSQGGFRRN